MATERSITPGRKAAPKNYRLPEELFGAVSALSDLFHAGTIIRVGEDAVSEQLIELGFLPATKKAAAMPTAETVTTKEAVATSLEDVRELLESMHARERVAEKQALKAAASGGASADPAPRAETQEREVGGKSKRAASSGGGKKAKFSDE